MTLLNRYLLTLGLLVFSSSSAFPLIPGFSYVDFSSTAGLNLVGAAAQNGNVLRMTPAAGSLMGSAWYAQPQTVAAGFNTSFSFRFTNPTPPGADGISFNIQTVGPSAVADEQGTTSGIGISLNTFLYGDEPSDNFVAIYRNGYADSSQMLYVFNLNSTPIYLKDGNVHTAAISYNGSAMSVWIDSTVVFNNIAVSLSPGVDVNGNGYVGFGARTGSYYENQDLLSWTFTSVPEPGCGVLVGLGIFMSQGWRRRMAATCHGSTDLKLNRSDVR